MRDAHGFGFGLLVAALGLVGLGCSTDTAGLGRRATPNGAGEGGEAGAAGPDTGASGAATASGGAGGGEPAASDPGPGSLDIVHGLVDGGRLLVCRRDAANGGPLDSDVPEPNGGVSYGQSLRVPIDWDPTVAIDVELFVASSSTASAMSCSQLRDTAIDGDAILPSRVDAGVPDAGLAPEPSFPLEPEAPRRAGSVRLSPGVVRAGAHYVLVATGCTSPGGNPSDDVCGRPDPLFQSRQSLVLAEIGTEIADGAGFGLQFMNASRAVSRADVVLQGNTQRDTQRLTSDVQFGSVRPREALSVREPIGLELHVEASTQSSYTQAWTDTLDPGSSEAFVSGENYLLVYVGPAPGSTTPGVASPRFVLIAGRSAEPAPQ